MERASDPLTIEPGGALRGRLRVPGDKSISHRALLLAAIAEGDSRIAGLLDSRDVQATARCLRELGVVIEPDGDRVVVRGVGLDGLQAPERDLDCGNSGTTLRLISGILAGQSFESVLTGDASLRRRPMRRIIKPLRQMGAEVTSEDRGRPPLRIAGTRPLMALHHSSPHASAQVKSCVLLAGLYADGQSLVTEPSASRDHTERMLAAMGCPVERLGNQVATKRGARPHAADFTVPADPSAAAFFAVAASIIPGSEVVLEGVGVNATRDGFLHILTQMGADIALENEVEAGGESVADVRIRYAPLEGVAIDPHLVPSAIDEFPILFVAAACARGQTTLTGAQELRVKESDRIAVMGEALSALGVDCRARRDGMQIHGGRIQGGEVDAAGDHRCAMALAVAGLSADAPVTIRGAGGIATSYPGFMDDLRGLVTAR